MSKQKGSNPTRANKRRVVKPVNFSLAQAERMLPLVAHITDDFQTRGDRLAKLEKEQADLDRRRLKLNWPERARRYDISEEIAKERQRLGENIAELEQLEVVLSDPNHGEVAFPTIIQGKRAFYVWRVGSETVNWWCYANEPQRHVIPLAWRKQLQEA
jgi:hypothetical protein